MQNYTTEGKIGADMLILLGIVLVILVVWTGKDFAKGE
jgi:hypothetical protein